MSKDLIIGSHVGMNATNYYLGSVEEALSYGATTFMFYTGAPQNSIRKPLNELKIAEGRQLIKNNGIDEQKIVVHAPYVLNLANDSDYDKLQKAKEFLKSELIRTEAFGSQILVFHPGAHIGKGSDYGIKLIAKAIDDIYDQIPDCKVKIALETMAGKGTEIGSVFEEIQQIIASCRHNDRLGVCIDTCHMNDSGYDVFNFDDLLDEFDKIIGINRILVVHVNDSKNPRSAHKDRHENIGYGEIGFKALNAIVNHPKLKSVPKILETPYVDGKAPYKKEIEMFRNEIYEDDWRNRL